MEAAFQPVIVDTSLLYPHPLYPDTSVFLSAQWGTGSLFLGSKYTPAEEGEAHFIAHYYREPDGAVVVEFWPGTYAQEEMGEMVEMSYAEFAWLLECWVDLSVTSAMPEFDSNTNTNFTLYQYHQEPSAGHAPANLEVDVNTCDIGHQFSKSRFFCDMTKNAHGNNSRVTPGRNPGDEERGRRVQLQRRRGAIPSTKA